MGFNFELIIFFAVVITGAISLLDILFMEPRRKALLVSTSTHIKMPIMSEYARSFFPILLMVFLLRSFLYEPFRIPSGSLKPTLLVGDFILVNKFTYGIRLPVIHKKIFFTNEPKRGEIVVFREPPAQSRDLIKRVIGLPGDHISYINKTLYINGQEASQQFEKFSVDQDDNLDSWRVEQKQENLLGLQHGIYQIPDKGNDNFYDLVVPKGEYFMMGDNRDDSEDSRSWGFLPEENIIGKATIVWMSWDTLKHPLRGDRIGMKIK